MSYQHDRCMSGEIKMFEIETDLMNYWHDWCMSGGSKILNTETGLMNYMIDIRWMWGSPKKTCQEINGNMALIEIKSFWFV